MKVELLISFIVLSMASGSLGYLIDKEYIPCNWPSQNDHDDCEIDTSSVKKPPGMCNVKTNYRAKKGLNATHVFRINSTAKCYRKCKRDINCQMAVIHSLKNKTNCRLYKEFGIENSIGYTVFTWQFCHFKTGHKVPGRCDGQWKYIPITRFYSIDYKYYRNNVKVRNVSSCQRLCQTNPVCGAFNYNNHDRICHIIKSFDPAHLKIDHKKYNYAYVWRCADNQSYTTDQTCVKRNKRCHGNFRVDGMGLDPSYLQLLLDYHTHNFSDCLINCKRMSLCGSLLYSSKLSRCLLMSKDVRICSGPLSHHSINDSHYRSYVRVTWFCCKTSKLLRSDLQFKQSDKWPCGCLANTNVLVKRFDCNADSGVERFMDNQTCENARIHCSEGQCFRILKTWNNTNWWFYLVFTGYENFVIRSNNTSFIHIKEAGSYSCQFYNSSVPMETQRIVTRAEWCASNRTDTDRYTIRLKQPVTEIFIGYLSMWLCFCRSREACANLLVDAQKRQFDEFKIEFPYNFVIGPNGDVFEGLGWSHMWQAPYVKPQSPRLLVAFAGNFTFGRPTVAAASAGRRLIQTGVSQGYIAINHAVKLAGHRKTRNVLYDVVGLWPNFNGRSPLPCNIFNQLTVLVNIFVVLFILGLVIAVDRCFFHHSHSRYCARLLTDLQHCAGEISIHLHNEDGNRVITRDSPEEEPLCPLPPDMQMTLHQRFHVQYTSCFWLSPHFTQRSQHRNCRCALSLLLQQHQASATPLQPAIHIPSLAPLGSSCNWASLIMFCSSFSILRPSVLIIAHFPHTDPRWLQHTFRSLVANFQAKRCLCKTTLQSLELHKLETTPPSSQFVTKNPIDTIQQSFDRRAFWINFNELPYLL